MAGSYSEPVAPIGPVISDDLNFRQLTEMWRSQNRFKNKSSTDLKYDYIIEKHIYPILGDFAVSDMNTSILLEYVHNKLVSGRLDGKGGLSTSYVRTIIIIINSILEFGYHENLCKSIKIKKALPSTEKYTPRTLSRVEQLKLETHLLSNLSPTNVGILLAIRAGLRIGEVCALSWNDINFDDRILSVRKTVTRIKTTQNHSSYKLGPPKTKTSVRDIPITKELYNALIKIYQGKKDSFVLSSNTEFVIPPTFEYRYHKTLKQAGITDINFHALRHTFATRCIESGMDDKSLSEILGHANVSITLSTYVHSSMDLKRQQMLQLSDMLAGY